MTVVDTAGLREAAGAVEAEGIRRATARAASADLVLWLQDVTVGMGGAAARRVPAFPGWRSEPRST